MNTIQLPALRVVQNVVQRVVLHKAILCGVMLCGMAASVSQLAAEDYDVVRKMFLAGEYAKCLNETELAIESGNDEERWFLLKLDCLMTTGQYTAAQQTLVTALEVHPNSIQLRLVGHEVWNSNNDTQRAREILVEFDELVQYRRWRYRDAWNQTAQGRYQLLKKTDAKEVMEKFLTPASLKASDESVAFLAIGDLGLAKHDYALAEENYRKATELDPENPAGFLGLAYAWRPNDFEKTNTAITQAMDLNPNYVPGLHYLVDDRLNSESYDEALEYIERILKINPKDVKAWTYRSVIAHIQNDPDMEKQSRDEAFSVNERNPEIDYLIGKKLSQRYRFAEGARMQRRSLTYDPGYLPAKIQLANDLLRLGNAEEGWTLADEVYQQDGYNVVAYNLVTLGNTVARYSVLQRDGFVVRMEPKEADIYGDMVLDLLVDAKRQLCEKYDVEVEEPIFVEIFPKQQDFAIRTFGLPGGAGYLGVCFGRVITMNSPVSQVKLGSNWKSVLWHEYCHVVTLQKTKNRMPRWLSEGISVYEERLKDPSWGQVLTPSYRELILGDGLTPVSELSGAFVKPDSGEALQFAYYQSSMVVEYLVDEYGIDVLKRILDDLRMGIPINEVLGRYTGDVKLLDKEFADYAKGQANALASEADWTKPEFAASPALEDWQAFNAENPNNIFGLRAEAAALIEQERLDEAEAVAQTFVKLYPDYRGADNGYALLATIAKSKGDEQTEYEMLKKSGQLQSASLDVYQRVAELSLEREDWAEASKQAERWLAVNPLIPAPHRVLAAASEATQDFQTGSQSLKALTLMDPFDPADAFYRYAVALSETGKTELARREVLKCLEEAPRYRKAHELLLRLIEQETKQDESESTKAGKEIGTPEQKDEGFRR